MESKRDVTTPNGMDAKGIVVDEPDAGLNRAQRRALAKLKRIDGKLSKKIHQLQKRNER
jgi:hypothetical protein